MGTIIVESLEKLLNELTNLIVKKHDFVGVQELLEQRNELGKILQKLIVENVKKDTAEYVAVVEGIQDAQKSTRNALKGLGTIQETIVKISKVLQHFVSARMLTSLLPGYPTTDAPPPRPRPRPKT